MRPRFHYAWIVVGITFLTLIVAAGVRSVPGVLIVPLEHEFGWTRATISFAVSINLLLYGLIGPFAAGLISPRSHHPFHCRVALKRSPRQTDRPGSDQ